MVAQNAGTGVALSAIFANGDAIDASAMFGNALTASGNVVVTGAIIDSISTNATGTTMNVINGGDGDGIMGIAEGGDGNGVFGQNTSGQVPGAGVEGDARGAGTGVIAQMPMAVEMVQVWICYNKWGRRCYRCSCEWQAALALM